MTQDFLSRTDFQASKPLEGELCKFRVVRLSKDELMSKREEKRRQPNFKKIPFKCDGCVLGFTKRENYDEHWKKKHCESIGNFACRICQIRFRHEAELDKHEIRHYVCYRCALCKFECGLERTAILHCRIKHGGDHIGSIRCTQCDDVFRILTPFRSSEELQEHRNEKHFVTCDDCGKRFKGKRTLSSHIMLVILNLFYLYTSVSCPCMHGYGALQLKHNNAYTLLLHARKSRHPVQRSIPLVLILGSTVFLISFSRIHNRKSTHTCDVCKRWFSSQRRLESHVTSHSAELARKLSYCDSCEVQFKNIHVYRHHLKNTAQHAKETIFFCYRYECGVCHKRFSSKGYYKKHYDFYHLRKSNYKCDICDKLFVSDWRLKQHQMTRHGLARTRDHRCDVCQKMFYPFWRSSIFNTMTLEFYILDSYILLLFQSSSTLRDHYLIHSSLRRYMCSHCGVTFKQRAALHTHCTLLHKNTSVQ
ncbi:zinc finger protein 91-like [Leptidea sinapis]|uniref:zinc finger protein 91-like n=1 Tax=Leptidea sinapis TaxID=189913 RepID=UPI0021C27C59|nr:zinc finger protein 91-like [Leptidea sinapis]